MVHMLRITCFPLSLLALCDKIPEVHQCFVLFIALKYSFYIACIIQSTEDWPGDRQNYYKKPRICLPTTRHGEHLCVLFVADKPVEIIFMLFFLAFYCQVFFFSFPQHAHIIAIILYCLEHCISHCSDNFPCSLSTYHMFKEQCSACVGENPLCSKDFLSVFSIFGKMIIYIGKQSTCFEKQWV